MLIAAFGIAYFIRGFWLASHVHSFASHVSFLLRFVAPQAASGELYAALSRAVKMASMAYGASKRPSIFIPHPSTASRYLSCVAISKAHLCCLCSENAICGS